MKELYEERLATYLGPESCAGDGNSTGEALTGVRAGLAIELRNHQLGGPIQLPVREGNTGVRVIASGRWSPRSRWN